MDNFQRNSAGRFPYFLCELGEKTELIGRHIERRGEQKMTLQETIEQIHPLSKEAMDRAKAHWDGIAKPLHSLGKLEDVLIQIAGITGKEEISIEKRALLTFCADNGVVEENVTQSGQEVTATVAENFLQEKATAAILCRGAHADLFPIDIGMARDTKVPRYKVAYGAGLSSEGLARKIAAIEKAIAINQPDPSDPIDVLAKVGGFDIAGMAGVFLAGAAHGVPVVMDGFISCVAALLAARIAPFAKDYMIASHVSKEPAAHRLLAELGTDAYLHCDMCLGEGTGAIMLFPILDQANAVYRGMATFDEAQIETYVPLT